MRTIAVVNQKGGCGKTTISINLSSALAVMGKKVLLVDMDSQSHCAVGLAVPEEQIEQSIYDVLIGKSRNEPVRLKEILWQIADRFDLAPASIDLSAFEQQMAGMPERESCLKQVLSEVQSDFDYCVVDCPPSVGLSTFNALRAATDVIVPVETGYFSLHGLSKQLETLSILCERSRRPVNVRVVASMYDIRTKMAREIMAELRSCFGDKMFKTIINFNTKLKEAASFGQPICEYDSASKGRSDFSALAQEVDASQTARERKELINSLSNQLESISTSAEELLKSTKIPLENKQPVEKKETLELKKPVVPQQPAEQKQPTIQQKSEEQKQTIPNQQPEEKKEEQEHPAEQQPQEQTEPVELKLAVEQTQTLQQMQPEEQEQPVEPDLPIKQNQPSELVSKTANVIEKISSTARASYFKPKEEPRQPAETVPAKPEIETGQPEPAPQIEPQEPDFLRTEEKLSDYYGVSQLNDAVVFVTLYPRAGKVQIAGDFNNWQPEKTEMVKVGDSGIWQTKLKLPPGKHQYRLVVDGKWQQDPYNEKYEVNPFGGFNSIIEVV